jgi:N-acetyl-anhydromuramyl-L-alanine amidase AmpD
MRHHPKVLVRNNVRCQSDRPAGCEPRLIVLHDTEGANVPNSARDLASLGAFFDRLTTQASSHVAVDEDGCSARYVMDDRKAWTQAFYNPWCLSIEQIGFASDRWTAPRKNKQLHETARWIAWWNKEHPGIPIRRGRVSNDGRILRTGVIQHRDLGSLGGSHHDVSETFPMTKVLDFAREHRKYI